MNHRRTAYLLLLIVSIIWGVAGPVIKFTLHDFPPFIFLLYRFAISAVVGALAVSLRRNAWRNVRKHAGALALYAMISFPLTLSLLFLGFDKTSSLAGSLITATGPVFGAAAGVLFLRERVTARERAGMALALAGTAITVFGPLLAGQAPAERARVAGNLLVFLSVLTGVASGVILKRLLRTGLSPAIITHASFIVALVAIAPFALYHHGIGEIFSTIQRAPLGAHAGVWFMAIISGTLAYTLQNKGMKTIELGEAALFSYLFPIWAAPLALWWLGETITLPFILGACVIATGVVIAEHKRRQKNSLMKHYSRRRTRRG